MNITSFFHTYYILNYACFMEFGKHLQVLYLDNFNYIWILNPLKQRFSRKSKEDCKWKYWKLNSCFIVYWILYMTCCVSVEHLKYYGRDWLCLFPNHIKHLQTLQIIYDCVLSKMIKVRYLAFVCVGCGQSDSLNNYINIPYVYVKYMVLKTSALKLHGNFEQILFIYLSFIWFLIHLNNLKFVYHYRTSGFLSIAVTKKVTGD